ncbi:MAG: RsmB/NOP family class I SAM-dependent RNA methyltransferase [Lentisphaeraceae bacterium]|nr:RsmB/NOP family class I SAM-dependent RNA methyltransferase [Lentisphaeraceae bacterium]
MDSRTSAQANSYLSVVADKIYEVLDNQTPLDNQLRQFFRENKKYGSRDRRFIKETLYAFFRWYGWVKDEFPNIVEAAVDSPEFCTAILNCLSWQGIFEDHKVVQYLSERYSFVAVPKKDLKELSPEWIWDELPEDLKDSDEFKEILQTRPPIWIRLQGKQEKQVLAELSAQEAQESRSEELSKAVQLSNERLNLTQFRTYLNGGFEIQDLASQCLGEICAPQPSENWWDVCAGGGGKTMQLADKLQQKGRVLASDIRDWKLQEVRKRATRGKFHNIQTSSLEDARLEKFDGVLIDAPCSCTGVWRRNPELRWTTDYDSVEKISEVQKQILSESCDSVKVGGKLVYATCSLTQTENEQVVSWFLENYPEFELAKTEHPLTKEMTDGQLRIDFTMADTDAMFAAVFRRAK